MNPVPNPPRWRPRFTIRGVLTLTLFVGLLLAWRTSARRERRALQAEAASVQNLEKALRYHEAELLRARSQLEDRRRVQPDANRILWQGNLAGQNLRGMTVASSENAFQRSSLHDCNLAGATLQGGTSSFQLTQFDRTNLQGAKLTGGNASFQHATFIAADLTGAVLTGGASSFQAASFENATLVRARLAGSFQGVNLSGAKLQAADLTALAAADLATCYFRTPPTYDAQTKFPAGFDPQSHQWRQVEIAD